jgi:Flp pilus assembly protein TadG
MPFLLLLYMGSIEVSQVISVDQRLASVASTVGDLVARSNGSVTTGEVDDYFAAAGMIMTPYPQTDLAQLVTCVYVDADGNTSVEWSRGHNGAVAKTVGDPYPLPSEITSIATDSYVIVSEDQMAYTPWGGYFFNQSFTLYKQYFHMPRYGENIALT